MATAEKVEGKTKRGGKRPGSGRKKGTPNKTTTVVKDAILVAAGAVGEDGKGKDGLTGYLKTLARDEKKAFAQLLGKVLPTQITGDDGGPLEAVFKTIYEQR